VATRALEPQYPGAKNTHELLDDEAKGASPALMDPEALLRGAMRTCHGVARLSSRFNFLRVVLDFLFGCHKLNGVISDGGRAAIGDDSVCPLSHFPTLSEMQRSTTRQNEGGVLF
jgi:hypothetical protein